MLGDGATASPKRHRYSATVAALRAARRTWTAIRRHGPTVLLDCDGWLLPPEGVVLVADWRYKERSHTTAAQR
jgi:hypothetical protein